MRARQRNFSCLLILGVGVLLWWIWVAQNLINIECRFKQL